MYETCACVITLFYSATCALILSVISHWCLRGVHVLREALVKLSCDTVLHHNSYNDDVIHNEYHYTLQAV